MGEMCHHAIIVTTFGDERAQAARAKAVELGMAVSEIVASPVNGYLTFLVAPDGSKEGWDASVEGNRQRLAFVTWLDEQREEDDSSCLDWVVVSYGNSWTHRPVILADSEEYIRLHRDERNV